MANGISETSSENLVDVVPVAPLTDSSVAGIPKQVLEVADSCFEVFTAKELRQKETILSELVASYPDLSKLDLAKSIDLALTWKRQLPRASRRAH
jgi:hypothetical protein